MTSESRTLRARLAECGLLDPSQADDDRDEVEPALGWPARVVDPEVLAGGRDPGTVIVLIDPVPDPEERVIVVLEQRSGSAWALRTPLVPAEEVRLGDLDPTEDGSYAVELAVTRGIGLRWRIVLAPNDVVPRQGTPWERAEELERIAERHLLPIASVEIE